MNRTIKIGRSLRTMNKIAVSKPREQCGTCPIKHRALCSYCEVDELAVLDQIKTYKTYPAGTQIVGAGEPITRIGSVVTGVVALYQTMEDGRRQMVGLLLPSDYVGRPGRELSQYDVEASTDVTLCQFSKAQFEDMIERMPSIGKRLLDMTLDELDAAREWMLLLGRKSAKEKIASFLSLLLKRELGLQPEGAPPVLSFELPLTRDAMADYLGLTIETVSRQMTALRKTHVIKLEGNRHVIVPEPSRLYAAAGLDTF